MSTFRSGTSASSGWRLALGTLTAAMALTLALAANAVAAPSDPFKGVWTSTDTDGSHQILSFGGSGDTRMVHYFDDGASACGWPDIHATATLFGVATVSGSSANVDVAGQCNGSGQQPLSASVTYTYDANANTLTDSFGVTWSR